MREVGTYLEPQTVGRGCDMSEIEDGWFGQLIGYKWVALHLGSYSGIFYSSIL